MRNKAIPLLSVDSENDILNVSEAGITPSLFLQILPTPKKMKNPPDQTHYIFLTM